MVPMHPHHARCALFVEGKADSDIFTEHLALMLDGLAAKDRPVTLTLGADLICGPCPHNQPSGCESQEKVARYDRQVLCLCGLQEGDTLPWSQLEQLCLEKIVRPGRLVQVCPDCAWADICQKKQL